MATDIVLSTSQLNSRNVQSKRNCNITLWSDVQCKRLRQNGQEYAARNGEVRPPVQQTDIGICCGPKCTKPGCQLPEPRCYELFTQFWASGSFNIQTGILLRLMRKTCVNKRTLKIDTSRRTATFQYFLLTEDGMELQVCKTKFLRTFAISKGRIENLQTKVSTGALHFSDERGRHNNRPHRFSENVRDAMNEHIDSYPTYLSHYHRENGDPGRLYLSLDLTISQMFKDFVAVYNDREADSWGWAYRQIIKSKNLRIGNPKTDTCSKCDELDLRIKFLERTGETENDNETLMTLLLEQTEHHNNAQDGYEGLRADKAMSRLDNTYVTVTVDMQGVLFSPVLTNPEYYYLRKFSTHNLAIVETANDLATMCVWHCVEGKKGSCEVSSCLLKYCQMKFQPLQNDERRTLVVWTDRCTGQNNNRYVLMTFRYLITIGLFTTVHQKFLTTGYTFLPADRQFALIEKSKKGVKINRPDDWITIIMEANETTPSRLQKMNLEDFKRVSDLEQYYTLPNTLKVSTVKWIRLEKDTPNIIYSKDEISSTNFNTHTVIGQRNMENLVLENQYNDFIVLPSPLVKDLKMLTRWIPHEYLADWCFLNEYE